MTRVNDKGYIERNPHPYKGGRLGRVAYKGRDWWIIKYRNKTSGTIDFGKIIFNKKWVGKRIRIKIEEVKK